MKLSLLVFSALLFSASSFAAQVLDARIDSSQENLLVDVQYSGGCAKHQWEIQIGGCLESMPVQCKAKLIDHTSDRCEALIQETLTFSLKSLGLQDSYYKGALLTLFGDTSGTGQGPSKASVRIP